MRLFFFIVGTLFMAAAIMYAFLGPRFAPVGWLNETDQQVTSNGFFTFTFLAVILISGFLVVCAALSIPKKPRL